ncbi:MAG: hypothetical protein VW362_10170 [Candidatus Nanopelagicales bacterium]
MCDPISLTLGAVAGATVYQTTQARKSAKEAAAIQQAAQTDPAAERAKAEAEAAQRANAALADSNRRRREQGSLLSKGASAAPQFTLGDTTTQFAGQSPLSVDGGTTNRSTVAARTSLMSRGGVDVGGMPMRQGGQTYGGTKFGAGTL